MNAYLLSLNPEANIVDQWDFGFIRDFLTGRLWQTPDWQDFNIMQTDVIPSGDRGIVVLPARHHANMIQEINQELFQLNKVVLFLLGDEEAEFPVEDIEHPDIQIWVQNPHPDKHDKYNRIGTGYPQHLHQHMKYVDKDIDIFFSGQLTHNRREQMAIALDAYQKNQDTENIEFLYTEGFTQGLDHPTYYDKMLRSKITPCPSGAVIPDSFRLFESLECMAIPIADEVNPDNTINGYWDWLFSDITPFPKVTNWIALADVVAEIKENMPSLLHKQTAWWIKYKRDFVYKVMGQLND